MFQVIQSLHSLTGALPTEVLYFLPKQRELESCLGKNRGEFEVWMEEKRKILEGPAVSCHRAFSWPNESALLKEGDPYFKIQGVASTVANVFAETIMSPLEMELNTFTVSHLFKTYDYFKIPNTIIGSRLTSCSEKQIVYYSNGRELTCTNHPDHWSFVKNGKTTIEYE